jgi:hypothetical protein
MKAGYLKNSKGLLHVLQWEDHMSYLQRNLVSSQGVQFQTSLRNKQKGQYNCSSGHLRNGAVNSMGYSLCQQQSIFQTLH